MFILNIIVCFFRNLVEQLTIQLYYDIKTSKYLKKNIHIHVKSNHLLKNNIKQRYMRINHFKFVHNQRLDQYPILTINNIILATFLD